jgi:Na+-translocating ferredoxin:NAD+ oxidoreductase RNF subunit RnfB
MMSTDIVEGATTESVEAEVGAAYSVFVVDDNACTRCSVCVERCPTDTLYYARLPEAGGGPRTMAAVPESQRAEAE